MAMIDYLILGFAFVGCLRTAFAGGVVERTVSKLSIALSEMRQFGRLRVRLMPTLIAAKSPHLIQARTVCGRTPYRSATCWTVSIVRLQEG